MSAQEEEKPVTMEELNAKVDQIMKMSFDAQDYLAECMRVRHEVY